MDCVNWIEAKPLSLLGSSRNVQLSLMIKLIKMSLFVICDKVQTMVITFGNLYSDRSILISVFLEYINYAVTAAEPDKIRMDLLLKAMKVRLALSCVNPSVCLLVPCLYFVIVCSIFCLLLD